MKKNLLETGYIALTTVIIILAVVLITAMSVTFSSIGEAQSGLALFKAEENLHFVEGCVEDALLKIRSNSTFNDTTITRPGTEGTCTIGYNLSGPVNWDITVFSQSTAYQREIRVIFVRNATGITLTSWNEI